MHRLIGGFLPLRVSDAEVADSIYSSWCPRAADVWLLHNARSALNALWTAHAPPTVWLPAYICEEVARCVPSRCVTRYYPLDESLHPSVAFLSANVGAKDHVLAVDYFGRPASEEFVVLVEARQDIGWVQDCAHALAGSTQAWGDWLLYSPRKIVGVPDGGILVSARSPLPQLAREALANVAFVLPSVARLEDVEERNNSRWYPLYVETEERFAVGRQRMSTLALSVLKQLPVGADADIRRRNYEALRVQLGEWAFLGNQPIKFVPLGFPVRTPAAAKVSALLAAQGVFAPRHWASLPSDRGQFPMEHDLAETLLTLPCDYRYDQSDMERVARVVCQVLNDEQS